MLSWITVLFLFTIVPESDTRFDILASESSEVANANKVIRQVHAAAFNMGRT